MTGENAGSFSGINELKNRNFNLKNERTDIRKFLQHDFSCIFEVTHDEFQGFRAYHIISV